MDLSGPGIDVKLKERKKDCKGFENGVPDHIFLSSFHDSCTRYHWEKKEMKYEAGFYLV